MKYINNSNSVVGWYTMRYKPYNRDLLKKLLAVKLTILFAFFFSIQAIAGLKAQKINISVRNMNLKSVLLTLEQQSEFSFIIKESDLKKVKPITADVKEKDMEEALSLIFYKQPLAYKITGNIVNVFAKEEKTKVEEIALQKTISGVVKDDNGKPLAKATVQVKGTTNYTSTSDNGSFKIDNVSENAILVISFIGYKTLEVSVNSNLNRIVLVNEHISVDEVTISIGVQNLNIERATGSFGQVNQEILSKRPVANLSTALQGVVAGMQANENLDGSSSFLIRGTSSLYASTQPLVVVDGFPITNSNFTDINPNDVESITVLKDAAAASIWGARSANGVIVITTKRNAIGRNRVTIDASGFSRIDQMINLDQVMTQASSPTHIRYEKQAFDNEWYFNLYSPAFTEIGKSLTLAQEYLIAKKLGRITEDQMNRGLDSLSKINNRQQFRDLLMRNGLLNQGNLSFSSGTDKSSVYGSVMYENRKEGFKKRGYDRFLMNFNNQYQATSFLNISFGANVQYKNSETSGAEVGDLQSLSPYETLLNPDGSYSVNLMSYNREQMGLLPLNKFPYADWTYNLLREVRGRSYTREELSARVQGGLNIKIIDNLTFDSKIQYEKRRINNKNYDSEDTFYARNLVNQYTEYTNSTQTFGKNYLPKGGILRSSFADDESYVFRNQLNFMRVISSDHRIDALAGIEISNYLNTSQTNPTAYGYYPDKLQSTTPLYGYGSSVDQFKNFTGGTVSSLPGGNTSFGWGLNRYVSYYGNASYSYLKKYTLTGSIRNDASNFITDDPSLRWAPLWSIGGMWALSNENFMQDVSFVDRLAIRLTYGKNGNVEKSTSPKTLINVGGSISATTGTITASISDNGNPFLSWERTNTTNLGIDFSLFKNKFFGKIDVYNKLGENIMGTVALPAATGSASARFNNAEIINRGFELDMGARFDITKDLNYTTSVTYAYNWNRVNKLYFPALYAYQLIDGTFVEGRPVGALYSYSYYGMIDGVPQVVGQEGNPSTFNDVALHNRALGLPFLNYEGTRTPPHTLGWVNNFSYRNFNLMTVVVGTLGGVYRNPVFRYSTTVGSTKTSVDKFVEDVYAGNPGIPGFAKPKETQTYLWDRYAPNLSGLVESSSYIEFKELNLEYNLPQNLSRAIGMNNLKVFSQVRNLGLLYTANSKGYNPEWLPGANRPVTTYMFGVNLKF